MTKPADALELAARAALRQHLPRGTLRVVAALSGGADSVALLHVLRSLRGQFGYALHAAHLNHNLRGDQSRRDEAFVRQLCAAWELPLTVRSLDVARQANELGLSVEEAGRIARYGLFGEICMSLGDAVTATGHTQSDQAETVLLNLVRGAGALGLSGMPQARPGVIRPLLACSRAQVEQYCADRGLSYVTDATNLQDAYTRNHLRLNVLPLLGRVNPAVERTLARQAALFSQENAFLQQLADALPLVLHRDQDALTLDRTLLREHPPVLARRALRGALERHFGVTLTLAQSEQLTALCLRAGNGAMSLPHGLFARADYARLTVRKAHASPSVAQAPQPRPLVMGDNRLPGFGSVRLQLEQNQKSSYPVYIHRLNCDIMLPTLALTLRTRQPGDAYRPAGRRSKSLHRMAMDARLPADVRQLLPVVVSERGEILSAFPFGPAQQAAADPAQPAALTVTYLPTELQERHPALFPNPPTR